MCDQLLLESYKLGRCIRCKTCQVSKNARSALLVVKPLKLAKFLLRQKGYNKTAITNNVSENFGHFYLKETLKFCILIARRNHFSE